MHLRFPILYSAVALIAVLRIDAQEPAGRMSLSVTQGRMTCTIRNYPITEVLDELGARTRVGFVVAEDLADSRVSVNLVNVPIDEGVRRLLRGYDAFLYYGGSDDASSSLRTVWIYPKGSGSVVRPVPPESWAASAELRERVGDADARVREQAYMALMLRPDAASRELVLNALRGATETDDALRQRLLSRATQQGMEVPRDLLADVARADGSEMIRLLALDALASDPAVQDVAASLANDPSPVVQQRAKEILMEWQPSPSRRKPPQ